MTVVLTFGFVVLLTKHNLALASGYDSSGKSESHGKSSILSHTNTITTTGY